MEQIEKYIEEAGLKERTRRKEVVLNRYYLYAYLKKKYGDRISLAKIGMMFGGMGHAAILHGIREHEKMMIKENRVYYMTMVAETAMQFPIEDLPPLVVDKRKLMAGKHNRKNGEEIQVVGESYEKLKMIKKLMGVKTLELALDRLIEKTDLNDLIDF